MDRQTTTEPDQAFGAAATFIDSLAILAWHARRYQRDPANPDGWKRLGGTYAQAFIAWFDLSHLLTPAVRDAARRAYPVGAASIKVGKLRAKATVIEAIADELGVYFRNVLYQGRRHPLNPESERVAVEAKAQAVARQVAEGKPAVPFGWGADFNELMKKETRAAVRVRLGIKTLGDAWLLMAREWESQDPVFAESRLGMLRCGSIDFDDLRTQLDREAQAVIPPDETDTFARSGIASMRAHEEGLERVSRTIERIAPLGEQLRELIAGRPAAPRSTTETDWRDVQRRLLELYERGERYSSVADLAKRLGCGKATVQKAIKPEQSLLDRLDETARAEARSAARKLASWQARHLESKRSPRATSINDVVTDNAEQTREADPAKEAEGADWEIEFARLIEDAQPGERARLNAMEDEHRKELVAVLREDPDEYDRVLGRKA